MVCLTTVENEDSSEECHLETTPWLLLNKKFLTSLLNGNDGIMREIELGIERGIL